MAPATPPRSSTEVAKTLREFHKTGDGYMAELCGEAAEHIEALVVGLEPNPEVAARVRAIIDALGRFPPRVLRTPERLVALLRSVDSDIGDKTAEVMHEAADAIEKLSADVAEAKEQGRQGVLIERGILTAAEKRYDDLIDAFAKFDGEDWDYLLGVACSTDFYRGGLFGRERIWQEALGVLRSICELPKPKDERPEPSALAMAFVKRWLPTDTPEADLVAAALDLDDRITPEK